MRIAARERSRWRWKIFRLHRTGLLGAKREDVRGSARRSLLFRGFQRAVEHFCEARPEWRSRLLLQAHRQPAASRFVCGRNVSAIVFEMDLDTVAPKAANGTRPKIRVWATTSRFAG